MNGKPGPKGWRRFFCHFSAAVVAVGLVAPIVVMFGDRRPIVRIHSVTVEPRTLIPGAPAFIVWKSTTLRYGCGGSVRRQLIDSSGILHDFEPISVVLRLVDAPGEDFSRPFIVPMNAAPGPGTLRTFVARWCNPVQQYIWPMHDRVQVIPVLIAYRPG